MRTICILALCLILPSCDDGGVDPDHLGQRDDMGGTISQERSSEEYVPLHQRIDQLGAEMERERAVLEMKLATLEHRYASRMTMEMIIHTMRTRDHAR